jgi:hypothetical protein
VVDRCVEILNSPRDAFPARALELTRTIFPEWNKEEARLIYMGRIVVDDRYGRFAGLQITSERAVETVRHDGSGGACSEYHDARHRTSGEIASFTSRYIPDRGPPLYRVHHVSLVRKTPTARHGFTKPVVFRVRDTSSIPNCREIGGPSASSRKHDSAALHVAQHGLRYRLLRFQNERRSIRGIPASTPESDAMNKDLKNRGFRVVGTTICYAFMQASGLVNDHLITCFRYRDKRQP